MSWGFCVPHSLRSPFRRRKNCFVLVAILLVGFYVWDQYVEMDDDGYSALRPLDDAESEARRLLTLMTHYNIQCNVTLQQVGNVSQWPLCESGFANDNHKLAYTIGFVI